MNHRPFLSSSWFRVAKLRPKLREHAVIHRHRYRGDVWYVIHDHATGWIHRLSPASYVILEAMDGIRTTQQLWERAALQLEEEAPSQDELIQLLVQLNAANLLHTEANLDSVEIFDRSVKFERARWWQSFFNPFAMRVKLWSPDNFFERTLPFVKWLIGWPGAFLWMLVVFPAVVLAAQHWHELTANTFERTLAADNILLMAASYILLKALHEFGHGYATKAFGGSVHEFGVMFIVFAPMPYVDASAAAEFRSKWRRALVGAAGMLVEIFVAALGLYTWLAVEEGSVRATAHNVILVAGISTIVFNGNPLMRYDGYYILSDILEIPNLAQRATRYWGYLLDRYVFRTEAFEEFLAARGERIWLFFYAPTSFLYRVIVMFAIAIFIASKYLAIGVTIAVWGILSVVILPVGRAIWKLLARQHIRSNRWRIVTTVFASISAAALILFLVPAPAFTTTEGVVWLPESAIVRAGSDEFIRRLLVEPGSTVKAGDRLIEGEDAELDAELKRMRARIAELEATLAAERFRDRVKAQLTATDLAQARVQFEQETERFRQLVARSRGNGTFAVFTPQDLPGRFVREGEEIGYVLAANSRIIRATITQDDIELVRNRLRSVRVRLAGHPYEVLTARIIREVPAGREELPSKALAVTGGGHLLVNPSDPHGNKTYNRLFQVDIELPSRAAAMAAFGSRAYIRFDLDWEPFGQQVWRRTRQLLLSRLST